MYKHPGAGWSIRPFSAADAGSCLSIFRDCLTQMPWRVRNRGQYMILRRALSPQAAWVAQEPDAGVVGFLTLQAPQDYVDHLFVAPDWRFCGVARGLLEVAHQGASGALSLDVDTENMGARRAYEALGWQVVASTGSGSKARQMRLVSP
ncbi:MAG: GNAT family N-acetyltransferase [Hyphomonas sp.]|uniref:N-acetyltransferase family protein n=1 Tax=Hyphomonas sp. TaxID=87 RepID=UPI0034A09B97